MNNAQICNQDSGVVEWYTPNYIIEAARATMCGIDLDPASCAAANDTVKATRYFTKDDDGLTRQWFGNVWMNHPYGREPNKRWPSKLVNEYKQGHVKQSCFICNASTSEIWFQPLFAYPICFIDGRMKFIPGSGQNESSASKGSAVVYLGGFTERFAHYFAKLGSIMIPYYLSGTKPCAICTNPFTPKRSDALYCSPACNQKAKRRRAAATL